MRREMIGVGMGNERKIPRPMRIQPQPEVGNARVVAVETERDGWGGGHRPGGYGGGGTCVGVPLNQLFIDPRTLPIAHPFDAIAFTPAKPGSEGGPCLYHRS